MNRYGWCAGAFAFALVAVETPWAAAGNLPTVRLVDPLVKVFPDSQPAEERGSTASVPMVVRGEHATFQLVVHSEDAIEGLKATVTDLLGVGLSRKDTPLKPQPARFVGYVPVDRPTQAPPKDQLRKIPSEFPDPLLELDQIDVPADRNQAVWITVPVPTKTRASQYEGRVIVTGTMAGKSPFRVATPIAPRVCNVTVPKTRLWVTNWWSSSFRPGKPANMDDPAWWEELRVNARMMADHRQNVALISALDLCKYGAASNGNLTFDWTTFDKTVQVFIDEGVIGRIEGGHLGGRGDWLGPIKLNIRRVRDGKVEGASILPTEPDADKFLSQFLPALVAHLREKGWLDQYMQHIADEPVPQNVDSYTAALKLVRKYAPSFKIIEAIHAPQVGGEIDVAVPMLNILHANYKDFAKLPTGTHELWTYTCCEPKGEYANRFIELPLIKTRLLHWINYRYSLPGYLHWGYNQYDKLDPFKQTTYPPPKTDYWPAGDMCIVYPGSKGPLSSIRFEAMRDGIVDHELLSMLAERDKPAADRLAAQIVQDFDKYELDVKTFRAVRQELIEKLEARSAK